MRLQDKVAIVTGAAGGKGQASERRSLDQQKSGVTDKRCASITHKCAARAIFQSRQESLNTLALVVTVQRNQACYDPIIAQ